MCMFSLVPFSTTLLHCSHSLFSPPGMLAPSVALSLSTCFYPLLCPGISCAARFRGGWGGVVCFFLFSPLSLSLSLSLSLLFPPLEGVFFPLLSVCLLVYVSIFAYACMSVPLVSPSTTPDPLLASFTCHVQDEENRGYVKCWGSKVLGECLELKQS